jgi:heme-degrading monooxygenase HmoA
MIVGIFRSRLRPDAEGYGETAERMDTLARSMPGFLDLKTFAAEDGERVSVFAFESLDALEAWRSHAEHLEAQRRGREHFYAEYELVVARPLRHAVFREGRREERLRAE